ncbi:putative HERC2-like protein 3 [Lingula anatina]|nr:putative HERC2-like protein 3 [Lingula anatina]|eukprot:XP_013402306.1 putative HERC2-like protein 3 [Lingula anatina]
MAKKMVPGTKVKRGRDWRYGNEDGDPPGQGKVVDQLFGLNGQDTEVSHIKVKWDKSGRTEKYRMGADGCYDLQLA